VSTSARSLSQKSFLDQPFSCVHSRFDRRSAGQPADMQSGPTDVDATMVLASVLVTVSPSVWEKKRTHAQQRVLRCEHWLSDGGEPSASLARNVCERIIASYARSRSFRGKRDRHDKLSAQLWTLDAELRPHLLRKGSNDLMPRLGVTSTKNPLAALCRDRAPTVSPSRAASGSRVRVIRAG
jgi:hypothetical protein